jgi:hypothetical protein
VTVNGGRFATHMLHIDESGERFIRVAIMTLQLASECVVLYDCDDAGLEPTCHGEVDESISLSSRCTSKAECDSLPKPDVNGTAATTTTTGMSWYDDDSDGSDEDDLAFLTPEIARKRLLLVSQNSVNTLDTAALSESQHSSQEECCTWSHSGSFCSRDDESEWHNSTRIVRFATCDSIWIYEAPDDDDVSLGELYYTADEILAFRETFYAEFVALGAASPGHDDACLDE